MIGFIGSLARCGLSFMNKVGGLCLFTSVAFSTPSFANQQAESVGVSAGAINKQILVDTLHSGTWNLRINLPEELDDLGDVNQVKISADTVPQPSALLVSAAPIVQPFSTSPEIEPLDPKTSKADQAANTAYAAADAAYKAYDRGDYAKSVEHAKTAVKFAPDNADYKSLLANAEAALKLMRQENAASAPSVSSADQAANAAYAALRESHFDQAEIYAQAAVRRAPSNVKFRFLLIDTLNQRGDKEQALAAVNETITRFGPSRDALRIRGVLRQDLDDQDGALEDFQAALQLPGSQESGRTVRLIMANALLVSGDPSGAYTVLRPLDHEGDYAVLLSRGQALAALGEYVTAEEALDQASLLASDARTRANVMKARILLTYKVDGSRKARQMLEEARSNGIISPISFAELATLAANINDKELAYQSYRDASERGLINGAQFIDAAYAAKKYGQNDEAISFLKQAIDEVDAGRLSLQPQQLFGLRRELSDISREWGASSSLSYGSSGISSDYLTPPASSNQVIQLGSEAYWRPPVIGYRDGRTVDLFVRQFTTLYDELRGPIGASTTQGSAGVRVKPFTNLNLVVEAAKYFKIGRDSTDDMLLRVAISGGRNTDLQMDEPSWWTGQYFGEIGRYMQSNQVYGIANASFGRSFKLGGDDGRFIMTPFIGISYDYNDSYANQIALGVGPGLSIRHWFRKTKYNAPMSYIEFITQYRMKLAGDDRAQGWFTALNMSL